MFVILVFPEGGFETKAEAAKHAYELVNADGLRHAIEIRETPNEVDPEQQISLMPAIEWYAETKAQEKTV